MSKRMSRHMSRHTSRHMSRHMPGHMSVRCSDWAQMVFEKALFTDSGEEQLFDLVAPPIRCSKDAAIDAAVDPHLLDTAYCEVAVTTTATATVVVAVSVARPLPL